uniref:Uncharacterized protein n=1 Tax=Rhizophora mucronata TaxID=61149 RepID=A0A2P2R4P9_RHIMU
MVALYLLLLI